MKGKDQKKQEGNGGGGKKDYGKAAGAERGSKKSKGKDGYGKGTEEWVKTIYGKKMSM